MLAIKNRLANKSICFLALTFILAGCTPPGPRALLAGKRLIERGRYEQAVAELKTATSLLPTNALAWNYLGIACHHAGKFNEAAQAYQKALALNHDLAEARYNLGCLWLKQDRLDAAMTELTTFTLRRGSSVEGWLKLGETQLRARDLNSAVKCFNEVLRLSPRQPEALNGLGLVLVQRGQAREAAQYFAAAIQKQPDYAPAWLNLAVVHQTYLDNNKSALKYYRAYLALKPRPANSGAVEAVMHGLEQENIAPAQSPPTVAAAAQPARNAEVSQHSERDQQAEPARTSSSAPQVVAKPKPEPASLPATTVQPNRRVVRVESEPKIETQPAIATGNPADDLIPPPDKTEAEAPKRSSFQGIGPENRKTGQGVTTTAASPRIISESTAAGFSRYSYHSPSELKPGDHAQAERYFARGARDYQNGRYADAAQAYRTATGLDPAYFDAYYNLGVAANAAGNLRQSLEAYEYALALKPDSVNARYNFALTLTRANYPVDAANELLKILASNPSDGRAHLALANLYAQQFHQPDNAREQYLQVLQYDPNNSQATAIRFWLKTHPR